eukprot:TRINITY_DN1037_c0_g1_i1.p1 TRINITY_DN1037_c0_g1~~TRINITY_DN1037_c0_g1_i1.p1  ORF type:complete len:353 (+),score=87.98 TRINITY_DN1037_c0_g1_i1:86-1144(+)
MTRSLIYFISSLLLLHSALCALPTPPTRSTWVYDVLGGQPAMWAPEIRDFNSNNTDHGFNLIFSYGGDMEYYPGTNQPYRTYFDNNKAVKEYKKIPGVVDVMAIVDGRMDGGQAWSPNLSLLNQSAVQEWADLTAAVYCSYIEVAGIAVDLEPFAAPYADNLLLFLTRLGADLMSSDFGCVNSEYPEGRYISTFLFAEAATPQVYAALGPNGFVVISGYDLSTAPAGTPSTPAQYGQALAESLSIVKANAEDGKFIIALPAAASTHEFTQYVPESGVVVEGYPMYNTTVDSYLVEAFNQLEASNIKSHPGYLGVSLWGFSSFMEYPPHTDNLYYPTNPFVSAGEQEYLAQNL